MINIGASVVLIGESKAFGATTWSEVKRVTIARKEFDGQKFEGKGYLTSLINEDFGDTVTHGVGFSGTNTNLQVNSSNLALPLYRFNFGFILDSDRLGEVLELFLLQYNTNAGSGEFRIRLQDFRLVISEPVDSEHSRTTLTLVEDNTIQGWIEKNVEYLLIIENITWDLYQGDLYAVDIQGTEVTIVTDQAGADQCLPAQDEEGVDLFEGLSVTEIALPDEIALATGTLYGIGVNSKGNFFAQGLLDGDDVFLTWDAADPNTSVVEVNAATIRNADPNFPSDTNGNFIATRVIRDTIISIDRNDENTENIYYFYNSCSPSDPLKITAEEPASNAESMQLWTSYNNWLNFLSNPAEILDTGITTSFDRSPDVLAQFNYGIDSFATLRHYPLKDVINRELDILFRSNGDARPAEPIRDLVTDDRGWSLAQDFDYFNGAIPSRGSLFYRRPVRVDAADDFFMETRFEYAIKRGGVSGGGTDRGNGFAIIFHGDGREDLALGAEDAACGFGDTLYNPATTQFENRVGGIQIQNSVAVYFDLVYNQGIDPDYTGTGEAYVGIATNGILSASNPSAPLDSVNPPEIDTTDERFVWVTYDHTTTTLEVFVSDTSTKPGAATLSTTIDLIAITGGRFFMGYTASTGAADAYFVIRTWSYRMNGRFEQGFLGAETGSEYIEWDTNDELVIADNHRNEITPIPSTELDLTTIGFQYPGGKFYNTIRDSGTDAVSIYETSDGSFIELPRNLLNSDTISSGNIPQYSHGIQDKTRPFRFYLTQGTDAGNVYFTEDWLNFTNIGTWSQFSSLRENEGQLYPFKDLYIVRSPSQFVLDVENDVMVDVSSALCPGADGTGLFGTGREIIVAGATEPDNATYVDAGLEQMIFCSRDDTTFDNIRCFTLKAEGTCPVIVVQPNIFAAGMIES